MKTSTGRCRLGVKQFSILFSSRGVLFSFPFLFVACAEHSVSELYLYVAHCMSRKGMNENGWFVAYTRAHIWIGKKKIVQLTFASLIHVDSYSPYKKAFPKEKSYIRIHSPSEHFSTHRESVLLNGQVTRLLKPGSPLINPNPIFLDAKWRTCFKWEISPPFFFVSFFNS